MLLYLRYISNIRLHSLQNNKASFILFRSFVAIFEVNLEYKTALAAK